MEGILGKFSILGQRRELFFFLRLILGQEIADSLLDEIVMALGKFDGEDLETFHQVGFDGRSVMTALFFHGLCISYRRY